MELSLSNRFYETNLRQCNFRCEWVRYSSIYEKPYNNTITGESWEYPEFKGYYSNFYAIELQTRINSFSIVSATDDLFLHLFTSETPKGAVNNQTVPLFPEGDVSFLHAITPIGNKSHVAELTGPQGWKKRYQPNSSTKNLSGKLFYILSKNVPGWPLRRIVPGIPSLSSAVIGIAVP